MQNINFKNQKIKHVLEVIKVRTQIATTVSLTILLKFTCSENGNECIKHVWIKCGNNNAYQIVLSTQLLVLPLLLFLHVNSNNRPSCTHRKPFMCRIARPASHPESVLTYLSTVLHAYDTSAT